MEQVHTVVLHSEDDVKDFLKGIKHVRNARSVEFMAKPGSYLLKHKDHDWYLCSDLIYRPGLLIKQSE